MRSFRILLVGFMIAITGYTGKVISKHGWNLFPSFFGDMKEMSWSGQFNSDFMCFLAISGLWVAWRHRFSPVGLVLGVVAFFGGIMFLAPYLLIAGFRADGDMKIVLLGKDRATS
jgi:hypothetical protein